MAQESIYASVLNHINMLEITADIDRAEFTMGNMSKGFIYDAHSYSFSDKERKVGFTETIARNLPEWELETTANILIVEKNSAATRLVEMGFSELTNTCIVTVGGKVKGIAHLSSATDHLFLFYSLLLLKLQQGDMVYN